MAEQLGPMLIFSVVFLGITVVIVGTMGSLFASNAMSEDVSSSYDVVGGITYNMWKVNDTPADVYAVITNHNVTEWPDWANQDLNSVNLHGTPMGDYSAKLNSRVHFKFYDQGIADHSKHTLEIWLVRNNTGYNVHATEQTDSPWVLTNQYRDFMFIREYKYNGNWWGDTQNTWYGVKSFSSILTPSALNRDNQSEVSFVGRLNTTIFISPNVAGIGGLSAALVNNSGVIKVGTNTLNMDLGTGKIGAFNLIADLLMFKLPGVPVPVNYIIGLPMWIMISLTIVSIVSRFIPTIPGL
jgi:hypothetical protein